MSEDVPDKSRAREAQADISLIDALSLEQIEVNLFRGGAIDRRGKRIFGGEVIAQSLLAAYETVEDRVCHSLHCYFIHAGDPHVPILFEVDRARDGGSFTTRRVVAIQRGRQIFNLAASFQNIEPGLDHQAEMPARQVPIGIPFTTSVKGEQGLRWRPIQIRRADPKPDPGQPLLAKEYLWMRARHSIAADIRAQQVALAYASDLNLLPVSMRPHGLDWSEPSLQAASLDHAMWFHRPLEFNNWHLYAIESPNAFGGRGFVRGQIFDASGGLIASVAQEGLIRIREPRRDVQSVAASLS